MRVLWITNMPIAHHRIILNLPYNQSGGWMETAYESIKDNENVVLGVATIYRGKELKYSSDNSHEFYLVPSNKHIMEYSPYSSDNLIWWRKVLDMFKPDLIQLWGTEFSLGLSVIKLAPNIPKVVYIQGMMKEIYHHYFDSMSLYDRIRSSTLRSILKKEDYWTLRKKVGKQAQNEAKILSLVDGVIVESDWCAAHCLSISNNIKIYKSKLPVNPLFASLRWQSESIEPYTIFTTAGVNCIKGHHVLLKALSIVKDFYPTVKLYEPGENYYYEKSIKRRFLRSNYVNYIVQLEKKYNLSNNIYRVGRLTPVEMVEYMSKSNIFVMPSIIENHSSTLIEAMTVGAPVISSCVGGVSDYLVDKYNGLLYRHDEHEVLAFLILELFSNIEKAKMLSHNAIQTVNKDRLSLNVGNDLMKIYTNLLGGENE